MTFLFAHTRILKLQIKNKLAKLKVQIIELDLLSDQYINVNNTATNASKSYMEIQ